MRFEAGLVVGRATFKQHNERLEQRGLGAIVFREVEQRGENAQIVPCRTKIARDDESHAIAIEAALAPTHGKPASPMKRRNCSASGWSRSLAGRSIARKNDASDEKVAIQVTIWCRRRLMMSPIGSATAMAPIMNSPLFGSAIMKPLNSPTSSSTASPGKHGKAARAMAAQPRAGRDQPDRVGAEQRRQCIGDRQLGMAKLGQGQGMVQSEGDEEQEQARRNDGGKNSARNIAPGIDVFTAADKSDFAIAASPSRTRPKLHGSPTIVEPPVRR